jgi:outer membrane immunogenic protein
VEDRFDYLASARTRLGFTPWQSVLFYGTAGPAWLPLRQTSSQTTVTAGVTSVLVLPSDHFGLAVGGGAEVALGTYGMAGWLARIEYLHYDFGANASSVSTVASGGVTATSSTGGGPLSADVVRDGLSFKFH